MKTVFLLAALLPALAAAAAPGLSVHLTPEVGEPGRFAAAEIRREAEQQSSLKPLRVELTLSQANGKARPQGYALEVKRAGEDTAIVVRGTDAVGAMYGGLDVAEAIRTGSLDRLSSSQHAPVTLQRGIKFNLPLDLRTPTYTEPSDAAQANLPVMWDMGFWESFLDDLARHRYNVLSLWSLNPFPSMVKVPEFPNVALNDVWRTREKFDGNFSNNGHNFVRPAMLENREVIKRITIDEKIAFWRAVMQRAHDRGIKVYLFTWNIFLYGAEGKDGITSDKTAPRTIEYFRASVREMIRTYPLLAGIGITAGEGMMPQEMGGMDKEEWLWRTYGEGIRDGLRSTPERDFRLIHRFHMTGLSGIRKAFADLPCTLDVSFKYAIAHMYSVPKPAMIEPVLPLLNPQLRSWLTIRNDDVYSFRWADLDYARAFIKALPPEDKIAGFYMGPDGYVWGLDFLTRDPAGPRETVIAKQWLSFAMWGRLAYEPDLPAETFHRLVAARFPGAETTKLVDAWARASRTFPMITRFFWGAIDIRWFPEACRQKSGFYTVRNFMEGGSMPGAGVLNVMQWRQSVIAGTPPGGTTPLEIAAALETNAREALDALGGLRGATIAGADRRREYDATLNDIEAMAHLGNYYAAKTRGACELALFDKTGDRDRQAASVGHLERALAHWRAYSTAYTRQYVQPVLYNRSAVVDIPGQTGLVEEDVRIARGWTPGTIDESRIKHYRTEPGFKE